MREDERDRVSRQGSEAWRRLKKEKSWIDWVKVGEALIVGREWAMNQAGTNRPEGKGYNMAFAEWMERYKLHDMDKGDRSRLFQVMDALPMIEEWRRRLTLTERLKLNHPNAVLRKWKADCEPEAEPKESRPSKAEQTSTELAVALDENAQLKAHIAELEAARDADQVEQQPQPNHRGLADLLADLVTATRLIVDNAWINVLPPSRVYDLNDKQLSQILKGVKNLMDARRGLRAKRVIAKNAESEAKASPSKA